MTTWTTTTTSTVAHNMSSSIRVLSILIWMAATKVQYSQGAWTNLPKEIGNKYIMDLSTTKTSSFSRDHGCHATSRNNPITSPDDQRQYTAKFNNGSSCSYFSRRRLLGKLTLTAFFPPLLTTVSSFPPLARAQEPTPLSCVPAPDGSPSNACLDASTTTTTASTDGAVTTALSAEQVAEWMHGIPTFSLVDKEGVPYMVVGEDAKVTGYFFTSFEEAKRILQLARNSAESAMKEQKQAPKGGGEESLAINPWKDARISSIPLDVAVTLVTKSTKGNIFLIAPAAAEIEQALELTGLDDLAEGKVPLFYFKDFTNSDGKSPLYFNKSQLLKDFDKTNAKKASYPPVLVTELFAVLSEMVRGGNSDVFNLVLMPPSTSFLHAKECNRQGGDQPPFVIGQRNLVL